MRGCGPMLRLIPRNVHVNCVPLRPCDQATHHNEQKQEDGESSTRTHRPHMRRTILSLLAAVGFSIGPLLLPAQAANRAVPATPVAVAVYARVLSHINPEMPRWQSRDLARRVLLNAVRWRLDANMLVAIVTVESRWHTHALSRAGAIGLGQLMPGTAALLGVNPHDPEQNISGAARYLRGLVGRFGTKHYDLVFAAYNAGPKAVSEYGGIPPFDETQNYVVRVLAAWEQLSKTVRLPANAYAVVPPGGGADLDYWLEGPPTQ
jgi:soluble lytic murein transglycosylase-like protein